MFRSETGTGQEDASFRELRLPVFASDISTGDTDAFRIPAVSQLPCFSRYLT